MGAAPSRSTGIVTSAFGRHYEVACHDERIQAFPRGKRSAFACGDEVEIEHSAPGQGVITDLRPRRNMLWRADAWKEKLIAANLDLVVIVVACEPPFSDSFVSRCLCAANAQSIDALIVLNKIDLTHLTDAARERLAAFAGVGYPVLELSARHSPDALARHLSGRRSILIGQSGMGKSTLTNTLYPEADAATREISTALSSGKHTTTVARLYPLPDEGWFIDSPGLQSFGLAQLAPEELASCFPEFVAWLHQCRFRNCQHRPGEKGCAIQTALACGAVHPRRYEHYCEILADIESARKQRPERGGGQAIGTRKS